MTIILAMIQSPTNEFIIIIITIVIVVVNIMEFHCADYMKNADASQLSPRLKQQ